MKNTQERRKVIVMVIVVCFLAGFAFFVWQEVSARSPYLRVSFLDVGQGDAILIAFPGGTQILIDGGPDQSVLAELSKAMPKTDRTIELVILTHPDADHLTGLLAVLERYEVLRIMETGVRKNTALSRAWDETIIQEGAQRLIISGPTRVRIGDHAALDVLWPRESYEGEVRDSVNGLSVVGRLQYGATSFLFTGDIEAPTESRIVFCCKALLDADVFKVAHHGSKTSSFSSFLAAATPEIAIISVGKKNRYGHPAEAVLSRLSGIGSRVIRTDEQGTIVIQSDGRNFQVK